MDLKDSIFIKFGEEEHLKQIVNGKIRFAPSQNYIKTEMLQKNKGQGDLLEGKWVVHAESFVMESHDTHERVAFPYKANITIGTVDVNNMPVFCLSRFDCNDLIHTDERFYLPDEIIQSVKKDFPKATHALIIFNAEEFVKQVSKADNHKMISDNIHYYDYDINDIRMMSFLTTGDELSYKTKGITFSMTYENRYRHLLCKNKVSGTIKFV